MREVVICGMARTPFGRLGGALRELTAPELGAAALRAALERAHISGDMVDEVIMGMVITAGAGQVPGRQAAVKAGIPHEIPSVTINKVCGSAMKAVTIGCQMIKAGDADIIAAGGMESMSNAPYLSRVTRWGNKMGDVRMVDAMVYDGLWCPENDVHMAVLGGLVAKEYGVSREDQDKWALRSQIRWAKAQAEGKFQEELVPVEVKTRRKSLIVDRDEAPRPDTTLESLARLSPVYTREGTVTAGNAPGVNDGASAVILMSGEKARALGVPILAKIVDYTQASRKSKYIATVPGLAIEKMLHKNGRNLQDFDLIEINEAFAAVPLVSCKLLGMDEKTMEEKVNVNGSAVAVGHPIGATGTRLIMTMVNELRRTGKKNGICAICSGMAQADAVWLSV